MVIWVQPVLRRGKGPQEAAAASLEEPRAHNAEERVTEGGLQVVSVPLAWLWPLSPGRLMWSPDARLFAHSITPFSQCLLILQSLASSQSQGHRLSQGPDWVSLLVDLVGFLGLVSVGRWGRTHQARDSLGALCCLQARAMQRRLCWIPLGPAKDFCPSIPSWPHSLHTMPFPRRQMLHKVTPNKWLSVVHTGLLQFLQVRSSGRAPWAVLVWGLVMGLQSDDSWSCCGMDKTPHPYIGWWGFLTAWWPRAGVSDFPLTLEVTSVSPLLNFMSQKNHSRPTYVRRAHRSYCSTGGTSWDLLS